MKSLLSEASQYIKNQEQCLLIHLSKGVDDKGVYYQVVMLDTDDVEDDEDNALEYSETMSFRSKSKAFIHAFDEVANSSNYHDSVNVKVINKL